MILLRYRSLVPVFLACVFLAVVVAFLVLCLQSGGHGVDSLLHLSDGICLSLKFRQSGFRFSQLLVQSGLLVGIGVIVHLPLPGRVVVELLLLALPGPSQIRLCPLCFRTHLGDFVGESTAGVLLIRSCLCLALLDVGIQIQLDLFLGINHQHHFRQGSVNIVALFQLLLHCGNRRS